MRRTKLFTRRALVLGGIKLGLASALAGRLYQLQVIDSDRYRMQAEENRINYQLLAPPRGRILDRFGEVLAVNRQTYRLILTPEQTLGIEEALAALGRIITIDAGEVEHVLKEARRSRSFVPITVKENLTWSEVARIEVNAPSLPGVMIDVGQSRHYPFGPEAAHLVGYVGAVSESELTDDPLLSLPDFNIGKNGVEKSYDLVLRGSAGARQVEVNAYGRIIRELSRRDGEAGDEFMLTIDMGLQQYASVRLGEESAAAAVLDVHTGEVLVLASTPSFDPNLFATGISHSDWQALVDNPRAPLSNKVISGQYPPGSTFKMIVALAALEGNHITRHHRVFCPGHVQLGNRRFHCWRRGGHGSVGLVDGIYRSCDVFFYDVARHVGVDGIAKMARRFGFGEPLGLGLPGERGGLVPTKDWKMATYGVPWQKGETLVVGIGQGYMLATPLQLAVMAARIANGGLAVSPRLVRQVVRNGRSEPVETLPPASMNISPTALELVAEGMTRVTNDPGGTAFRARIPDEAYAMAGKTGSSQVRRISKQERAAGVKKNEELPWKQRDHALFVAFAPVGAPRYAVGVVVEHGGSGSRVAAPIARDLLWETQKRDPSGRTPTGPFSVAALAPGDGE
ncbi:MAG: penicillin-binding protein 2 [Alphaproteobacteria bacterium]